MIAAVNAWSNARIRYVEDKQLYGQVDHWATANATLRTMYQKAREASVPLDTIERAIKRGTGELEGVNYENVTYEGYAPNGVALLVECLTDNRNRTGGEIRSLFSKNGGSLAEPGAVAWQFARTGVIASQAEHGSGTLALAGHGLPTLGGQPHQVFEAHGTCSVEGRQLAQAVARHELRPHAQPLQVSSPQRGGNADGHLGIARARR